MGRDLMSLRQRVQRLNPDQFEEIMSDRLVPKRRVRIRLV